MLVAAREPAGYRLVAGTFDDKVANETVDEVADFTGIDKATALHRRVVMIDQNGVLSDRKIQYQSFPITILRDVCHASIKYLFGRVVRDDDAVKYDLTGLGAAKPRNYLGEFALTIAVDARDAQDFPG